MILRNNAHSGGIGIGPGRGRLAGLDEDERLGARAIEALLPWDVYPPVLAGISGDRAVGPIEPCPHSRWLVCGACWPVAA